MLGEGEVLVVLDKEAGEDLRTAEVEVVDKTEEGVDLLGEWDETEEGEDLLGEWDKTEEGVDLLREWDETEEGVDLLGEWDKTEEGVDLRDEVVGDPPTEAKDNRMEEWDRVVDDHHQ